MSRWGSTAVAFTAALVVVLAAAACAGPEKTERWTAERAADDLPPVEGLDAACAEVEVLALGALADESELSTVVDELSRMAAVLGATDALPAFEEVRRAPDEPTRRVAMTTAAAALDTAAYDHCEIPFFTALYGATGWADCHGEVDIAVALYRAVPDPDTRSCNAEGVPIYLPCWDADDETFLPVDCRTDEVVHVVAGDWVAADTPRSPTSTIPPPTVPPTTLPSPSADPAITTTSIPTVVPEGSRACRAIDELFVGDEPLTGDDSDLPRMIEATAELDAEIMALLADFEEASRGGWSLDRFEALVIEIDRATADACGVPLISAAHALEGGVDELPCWVGTGVAYPSHEPVDCPDT